MGRWILTSISANKVTSLLCLCAVANIVLAILLLLQKAGVFGQVNTESAPPPRQFSHLVSHYFSDDLHLSTFQRERADAATDGLAGADDAACAEDRHGDQREPSGNRLKNHSTVTCGMGSFAGPSVDWIYPWLPRPFPSLFPSLFPVCTLVESPMITPLSSFTGDSTLVMTSTSQHGNRGHMRNSGRSERALRPRGCVTVGEICLGPLPCCKGAVCMPLPESSSATPTCYPAEFAGFNEDISLPQYEPIFEDTAYLSSSLWFKRRPRTSSRS